jgi:hypothetical protein
MTFMVRFCRTARQRAPILGKKFSNLARIFRDRFL